MMKRLNLLFVGSILACFLSGSALSVAPATAQGSGEKLTLEVMNPRGALPPKPLFGIQRRVPDLAGKIVHATYS